MNFNNKKFKKSVAFLASSTSLLPVLSQNIQETKVFADGIKKESLAILKFWLKKILERLGYLKEETNKEESNSLEQDSKDVKKDLLRNSEEESSERGIQQGDNIKRKSEEDTSKNGVEQSREAEESNSLEQDSETVRKKLPEEYEVICFNEKELEKIRTEPAYNDSVTIEGGILDWIDEKNYQQEIEDCKYVLRDFEVIFSKINTDSVEFLRDEKGNQVLVCKLIDEKTGNLICEKALSFCVNSEGSVFVKLHFKRRGEADEIHFLPARMFFGGALHSSRRINVLYLAGWMFLDPKKVMSEFLDNPHFSINFDLYIKELQNLLKVFEEKDKNGLLAAQARKSISLFKVAKLCAEKSGAVEQYQRNFDHIQNCGVPQGMNFQRAYWLVDNGYKHRVLQSFINAEPPKNCSQQEKETYEYLSRAALDYARYVGIEVKLDVQDELNNDHSEGKEILQKTLAQMELLKFFADQDSSFI